MSIDAWRSAERVLVVRLDNLGDVLLCTPAIHAIREGLPAAHIALLAGRVGAQAGALNPDIDEVIVYQAPWMDVWQKRLHDSAYELATAAALRARAFNGAIIFTSYRQSSLPAAYLCYLADIPLRAAISLDGSGSLLTTRYKLPDVPIIHEVERARALVGQIGFHSTIGDLVLRVDEAVSIRVRQRLSEEGVEPSRPLIAIHPGCSMPARTYPWERYAEVGDLLSSQLAAQVVFTGAADEVELVERIRSRMRHAARSWAGVATFAELAALIQGVDVLVTNNTGPQHMAAALKTPVAVLFALTNPPEQWHPWRVPHRLLFRQVECALCYSRVCPTDHGCLLGVAPERVVVAVEELLGEQNK